MAVATESDEVALRRRSLPIVGAFQRFNSAVAGGRDRGVPPLPSFRKSSITDSFVVGNDLKPSTPKSPGLCQELDSIRCIGRLRLWSLRIVQQCGISLRQLRRDLEDNTVYRRPPTRRSAIKIAVRVEYQPAKWICSVAAAGKVMQRGVCPSAVRVRQLENRTEAVRTVLIGRAVEVASIDKPSFRGARPKVRSRLVLSNYPRSLGSKLALRPEEMQLIQVLSISCMAG